VTRALITLVHGGQQGAWTFDLLTPYLHELGYRTLAVELPIGEIDLGGADYAATVIRAIADEDEVVLVGHSMGGLITPLVAVQRPIARLIFVCAGFPEPRRSHIQVRREQPGEGVGKGPSDAWEQPGGFHMLPPEVAREMYFHDCSKEVQDWAVSKVTLQADKPLEEITPMQAWPSTPRSMIIATEDRCIPRDSALRTIDRLFGVVPIEIPGGHCPSLSRPALLATVIAGIMEGS